ncbi:MAG: DUF6624 domain-containing protein [Bacteroidota bacterium]
MKPELEEISAELIQMAEHDLAIRNELIRSQELNTGYHPKMEAIHRAHARRLGLIMSEHGYPTTDLVGREASKAAWLVIQHAISLPQFMKHSAELLQEAVNLGRASPIDLAYLSDRIAILEGRSQLYGTQFDWDEDGLISPQSMDDVELVNERREQLGLNTVEEQTQIMRDRAKAEGESAPIDRVSRQKEYDQWRREVGWIPTENSILEE